MPKPKVQPQAPAATPAPSSPSETAKATKLAQEQARLVVLEGAAQTVVPAIKAIDEAEGVANSKMWDLVDSTSTQVATHKLESKEVSRVLTIAMSQAKDIKIEEFKVGGKGANLLPVISKFKRIACPVDKAEAKLIAKERSKGTGFNRVYELLRKPQANKSASSSNGAGEDGSEGSANGKSPKLSIAIKAGDETSLKEAATAFFTLATNCGFDYDVINEVFTQAGAEHQAAAEADPESETEV